MSSYPRYIACFECHTVEQLYEKLESVAKNHLKLNKIPFPIEYLEQEYRREVEEFLYKCSKLYRNDNSDESAKELIRFLKKNPPKENYQNPTFVASNNEDEIHLGAQILLNGIDLPGSQFNPSGCGYFSDFFMDCYFGNLSEVKSHINKFTEPELKATLERREGYCQYSPLFAPILGVTLFSTAERRLFPQDADEFTLVYTRCNENKHVEILVELVMLGADPNAYDIWGHNALHYVMSGFPCRELIHMAIHLVASQVDCNFEDHSGWKPLDYARILPLKHCDAQFGVLYPLLEKKASPRHRETARQIHEYFEQYGTLDMVKYIKAKLPMCEYCYDKSSLKCAACELARYCSKACQKLDWKNHKKVCLKNKKGK